MTLLRRNPEHLSSQHFDLVIVGGGIHGCCLLLEASRRGWKTLLLERDDYGGATSLNSLRILHGGLRYLQDFDLARFYRSVQEQAWWLRYFPDLAEPLPCMMPLYNQGIKRVDVMRVALRLNDLLAHRVRKQAGVAGVLPASQVIDAAATRDRFPRVRQHGLRGAAVWHDVVMRSPQRLLIELLRWAAASGGNALNYMECEAVDVQDTQVSHVAAKCRITNQRFRFQTRYLVNSAGPWVRDVNDRLDPIACDAPRAEEHAIAFNLVLNRRPESESALAVAPAAPKGQTNFLVPYGERVMAGTCHLPPQAAHEPSDGQIQAFLDNLNQSVDGWNLHIEDVESVMPGRMLPLYENSPTPAKTPKIIHHAEQGGLTNLTTIQGPKYTTARRLAERTLREIAGRTRRHLGEYQHSNRPSSLVSSLVSSSVSSEFQPNDAWLARELQHWIDQESIVLAEDLVLRRLDVSSAEQHRLMTCLQTLRRWPNDNDTM